MCKNKCLFLSVIFLFFIASFSFGQVSLDDTNMVQFENVQELNNPSTFNKTALLFLEEAKKQLIQNNWDLAYTIAENALVYDSSIADLYYIQAISLFEKDEIYYKIVQLLEKSLSQNETTWYDFNKDSSRILLARLYVDIKKAQEAIALLDESPALNTSDAMLTRARAHYVLNDIENARKYVFDGASQYPLDTRFDELFYAQEYKNMQIVNELTLLEESAEQLENDGEPDSPIALTEVVEGESQIAAIGDDSVEMQVVSEVETETEIENAENVTDELFTVSDELTYLASFFNNRIVQFSKENTELLLYAAIFSTESEEKSRLLRAWQTQGKKHPLFAIHALRNDIMGESAAFQYMLDFFPDIELSTLLDFIGLLSEPGVIEDAKNYFSQYEGRILIDNDDDLIHELRVAYERGRPSKIDYDSNQDGYESWTMLNDYGEPTSLELHETDMFFEYKTWPFVSMASDMQTSAKPKNYYLAADTYSLPMVDFVENDVFKNTLSQAFYTPIVHEESQVLEMDLFNASYMIDFPTTEYANSRGRYTLLDGIIKSAVYTDNERPYAYTHFQNGFPVSRNVDKDGNGIYEVVEVYALQDSESISTKLLDEVFGFSHIAQNQYIQKIYVDLNNDGFDDFSQEYIANGGSTSSWDSDNDGEWDVQFSQNLDGSEREVQYVHPLSNEVQSVQIVNGIPVQASGKEVIIDQNMYFYWIGENAGSAHAEKIITELSLQNSTIALIVTDQLWDSNTEQFMRIVGIKNGDMYFGEVFYE